MILEEALFVLLWFGAHENQPRCVHCHVLPLKDITCLNAFTLAQKEKKRIKYKTQTLEIPEAGPYVESGNHELSWFFCNLQVDRFLVVKKYKLQHSRRFHVCGEQLAHDMKFFLVIIGSNQEVELF